MHPSTQFKSVAGALVCAALLGSAAASRASWLTTSNEAAYATASTSAMAFGGTPSLVNDQNPNNQADVTASAGSTWSALTWTSPQDLSRIIVELTQGYVVAGFKEQYSTVANPSGSVDANWQDIPGAAYTGLSAGGQYVFATSPGITGATGLRVLATDATLQAGDMRTREIWAFSHYKDLALTATVTAPGWNTGPAPLVDEAPSNQAYGQYVPNPTNTFTWATPQAIGGLLLVGGNGSFPGSFSIQSWNGALWSTITNITGNAQVTENIAFQDRIITTSLRLNYTAAGGTLQDGYMRVGEVFIFEAIPEPSTVLLFGVGGLMLWRRARKR